MGIVTYDEALRKAGVKSSEVKSINPDTGEAKESSYLSNFVNKAYGALKDTYTGTKELLDKGEAQIAEDSGKEGQLAGNIATIGRTAVGATGKVAEGVGGVIAAAIPDWFNRFSEKGSKFFGDIGTNIRESNPDFASKLDNLASQIDSSKPIQALIRAQKDNPDILPVLEDSINTIMLGLGLEKGAPKVSEITNAIKEGAPKLIEDVSGGIKSVVDSTVEKAKVLKEKISDVKTPEEIAKEVGQGKTTDAKPVMSAVNDLDVKSVKTYSDLKKQSKKSIKKLAEEQDSIFDKDTNKYKLNQLASEEMVGNTKVAHNYVNDAIAQLEELYTKINDPIKAEKIKQLKAKADTLKGEGLTAKEVNQLAREHSAEFGSKAFGKTGEPLTSVNAQAFENTRKGVKDVAREKTGNADTTALDERISNLYTVEKLASKMESAVNKLAQKMNKPNILQKLSAIAGKAIDITGIKSILKKGLDIGSDTSVLTPVELEARLSANLKKLEAAVKAGEKEAIDAMSYLIK